MIPWEFPGGGLVVVGVSGKLSKMASPSWLISKTLPEMARTRETLLSVDLNILMPSVPPSSEILSKKACLSSEDHTELNLGTPSSSPEIRPQEPPSHLSLHLPGKAEGERGEGALEEKGEN